MAIVRVGRRELNLAYLIMAEEFEDKPGARVTMAEGKEFEIGPAEVHQLREGIEGEREPRAGHPRESRVSQALDPETGEPSSRGTGEGHATTISGGMDSGDLDHAESGRVIAEVFGAEPT